MNLCKLKSVIFHQAKRSNVECIILPEGNRKDFDELQDFIKDGLEVHFVNEYRDVFQIVFPHHAI